MRCLELRGQGHIRLRRTWKAPWGREEFPRSPGEGTEETAGNVEGGRQDGAGGLGILGTWKSGGGVVSGFDACSVAH